MESVIINVSGLDWSTRRQASNLTTLDLLSWFPRSSLLSYHCWFAEFIAVECIGPFPRSSSWVGPSSRLPWKCGTPQLYRFSPAFLSPVFRAFQVFRVSPVWRPWWGCPPAWGCFLPLLWFPAVSPWAVFFGRPWRAFWFWRWSRPSCLGSSCVFCRDSWRVSGWHFWWNLRPSIGWDWNCCGRPAWRPLRRDCPWRFWWRSYWSSCRWACGGRGRRGRWGRWEFISRPFLPTCWLPWWDVRLGTCHGVVIGDRSWPRRRFRSSWRCRGHTGCGIVFRWPWGDWIGNWGFGTAGWHWSPRVRFLLLSSEAWTGGTAGSDSSRQIRTSYELNYWGYSLIYIIIHSII